MHLDPQDEERLSAYLDGELSSDEQARVEQLLADEPAARQLLDELRAVSSTLQGLPRTHVPGDLAADVLREIERRGVQRSATSGSRTLPGAVADALQADVAEPAARDGANLAKPSPEPSVKPYVEEPVDWRGRLIRPLVYAGIAVAVFAAVSFMTERAGDGPVPVARTLEEERAADAERTDAEGDETERTDTERVDKADRSDDTLDTDTDSKAMLGKEDGRRRVRSAESGAPPNGRFAAPASGGAAGEGAAGVAGMTLSKPGPMSSRMAVQAPGQAADPRTYYYSQAVANGEPVLVVQCRVTPEAVRQDLVGKLLAKNSVTVDDEAAAELDTAINTNVGYGLASTPNPDNIAVEQSAMPLDDAPPADEAPEPEMPTDLARQQAPAQESIAQEGAAPGAVQATNDDRDNKVAAKHRGETAVQSGDLFESAAATSGDSAASADEPTVYLIDASPEQLEGVLADLKSQTEGVVSLTVSPAPEAPTQNDYVNFNRGAPPEAVVVADEVDPFTDSPADMPAEVTTELDTDPAVQAPSIAAVPATVPANEPAAPAPSAAPTDQPASEPAAPVAASPPAPPRMAPAASQLAEQQQSVNQSVVPDQMVQQGQYGRRMPRRATNADEVRLQVQALGVLEDQLQNSPARNEKLERYGNASRARKLRPDTLSNFMPAPNAAAYGQAVPQDNFAPNGQAPPKTNQAGQAAAVNAPREANDAPAAGDQAATPQIVGAAPSRAPAMRRSGQRPGQLLQRAVIVLEVQPTPPAPAKQE